MAVRLKFTDQPGRIVPAARGKVRDDGDLYERTLVWESDPDQVNITYDVVRDDEGKIFIYEVRPTLTTDCGCGGKTRDAETVIKRLNDRARQFWAKDSNGPAPQRKVVDPREPAAINDRAREFWGRS